jgi:hypothetical protein
MEHLKITYWSDSLVTIRWIRGDASRRKSFVRNQVETIHSVSEKEWWIHCPEIQNQADLASRGHQRKHWSALSLGGMEQNG